MMSYRFRVVLLLFLVNISVAFSAPQFGQERVTVSAFLLPSDPFDAAHRVDGTPPTRIKARRGDVVTVRIQGVLTPGFHTYPVIKKTLSQGEFVSRFKIAPPEGIVVLDGIRESEPRLVNQVGVGELYEYDTEFTWEQDLLVSHDAQPGVHAIPISVNLTVCDERGCVPVNRKLTVEVEVTNEPPVSISETIKQRIPQAKPSQPTSPSPAPTTGTGAAEEHGSIGPVREATTEDYAKKMAALRERFIFAEASTTQGGDDLLGFLLSAVFFGAITLITPCVFPMIPITVSFFLKQSESENSNPLLLATVYCGTIVLVLTVAAVAFLGFFRALSVNPYMNYFIGGLFVFFALSLLGWYDIQLPSGLANLTSSREGQGGIVGTVFMALTFTIISFACVAPFLGAFGGMLAGGARPFWHIVLAGLAFAATFAAPFFFLALFPSLLKALPKSGSWLNSVKVVMGFLELAAAFKFFRTAELVSSTTPVFFTYDLVLGIWVALCLLCGLYLLGVYRLPHDHGAPEHISVPRLLWATAFLGLGFYLLPGLFKVDTAGASQRPGGDVYAWVDSFLLPEATSSNSHEGAVTGNLEYALAAVGDNIKLNRPNAPKRIFIDFTGFSCTNCRLNEQNVFTKPNIREALSAFLIVQLYTDKVPAKFYDPSLKVTINRQRDDAAVNLDFQRKVFKDETLPLYAIVEPRADGKARVLGTYVGRIFQDSDFADFLRDPQNNGQK